VLDPKRTIKDRHSRRPELHGWHRVLTIARHATRLHEEFASLGVERVSEEGARGGRALGTDDISFDVDGLDPVYAPGTGTPEVADSTTLEAHACGVVCGVELIGGDVGEVRRLRSER